MNKQKVYIAGRVSGIDYNGAYKKFAVAQAQLESKGYEAVNPTQLVHRHDSWEDAMRICIKALMDCDSIFLLPDYHESRGAQFEFAIAMALKMPIISKLAVKTSSKKADRTSVKTYP